MRSSYFHQFEMRIHPHGRARCSTCTNNNRLMNFHAAVSIYFGSQSRDAPLRLPCVGSSFSQRTNEKKTRNISVPSSLSLNVCELNASRGNQFPLRIQFDVCCFFLSLSGTDAVGVERTSAHCCFNRRRVFPRKVKMCALKCECTRLEHALMPFRVFTRSTLNADK